MKKKNHHSNSHHHHLDLKTLKKKLSPFYKISFSILLIGFIALFYFIVLVSTEPKSIPFVTNKIEEVLQKKFGENNVGLENSLVSFTRYGTLKVSVSSLNILYTTPNDTEKKSFMIPRLEAEFSLLKFFLLHFQPIKIKLINPNIIIDELQKLQAVSEEEMLDSQSHVALIIGILSTMRKDKSAIENFEIENAKLFIKGQKIHSEILLKRSQIRVSFKDQAMAFSSQNLISFDPDQPDVNFNSNCQLARHDGLKCDLFLENFTANVIANLHPSLSNLAKINAMFNGSASFAIKDGEMSNVSFKVKTDRGDFEFLDFFGQKMDFINFSASGEYDHKLRILDLSEISTDFTSSKADELAVAKPHLNMSLLISGLDNEENKKLDFYIKLQNVLNDELEKFWPTSLHEHGVREWVIGHMSGGMVKNAYAKFTVNVTPKENILESIDSQVVFSDFDLKYDETFPSISKLSGIANFTEDAMKISISSGKVLKSQISDAVVAIDSFSTPVTMLKISGKTVGHASDGLKHVNNESEFVTELEKYLNGNSQNDFDIRVPLSDNIALKNTYISVSSVITNLKNDYVNGGVMVNCKKDFNSTNFITNIDFTAAELTAKPFGIEKKTQVESGLDFVVAAKDPKKILIKNISLWKKEEVVPEKTAQKKPVEKDQKPQMQLAKVSGNLTFEPTPFIITSANFKGANFGKNNYGLTYTTDKKSLTQKITISGEQIDLASFIEAKFVTTGENDNFNYTQIQVSANRVLLMRNKALRNFYLAMTCNNGICYKGAVRATYGRQQMMNLRAVKKAKDNFSTIEGRINDVGYLAEGFGISNVISGGNAQVNVQNRSQNKKPVLEGKITIDSNITIFENTTVKRLSKDTLFSQIKDKIFSSEKTTFDSVKVEFLLQGSKLNLQTFIANNYKIGITAKGDIDLKNETYQLKGMIIPGFLINNLFGIGNIPILGNVISGLLTGGEGGGLFGISYKYTKNKGDKDPKFETNKVAAFVPSTIQNLFD